MKTWTQQKGFPIVTVTRNYLTGTFNLSQERYTAFNLSAADSSIWWIPINYASTATRNTFNETTPMNWFTTKSLEINSINIQSNDWLILNKQQTGYYRVLYDNQNYNLIANELRQGDLTRIHLSSRAQIIDDALEFAKTDRLNYTIVFDILKYLERELEYVPWQAAVTGLTYIDRMMSGSDRYDVFLVSISLFNISEN